MTIYVYNSGSLWLVLILTGIVVSCKRMFRTILIVFEINLSPRRNARISSEEMELDPSIHLFRNDIASFRDQSTWKIRKFPFSKMNKERTGILFNIQETSKRRTSVANSRLITLYSHKSKRIQTKETLSLEAGGREEGDSPDRTGRKETNVGRETKGWTIFEFSIQLAEG